MVKFKSYVRVRCDVMANSTAARAGFIVSKARAGEVE